MNYDLLFSILPLALLIFLMVKRNAMPAHKALPIAAAVLYGLKLVWFASDPNLVNATVLTGMLTALQPILIVWGAILLSQTLQNSGGMEVIHQYLNSVTRNRAGQLMIVGWAFGFLIEGVSGFGTPAALAAPVLVGLGFDPVRAAIITLIFNSVPVSFGAVGTPTWYGLSRLSLTDPQILAIGAKTAIIHSFAAMVIPPIALLLVLPWREVKSNLIYIYLSTLACVVPYVILAQFNVEFPSVVGGAVGLVVSIAIAKAGIGLSKETNENGHAGKRVTAAELGKASFPLWGTILILLVTRVPQLGIKDFLYAAKPIWHFTLGSLGNMSLGPSLIVRLDNVLQTTLSWEHRILYVPSIIPFLVICLMAFLLNRMPRRKITETWNNTIAQMKSPFIALCGALVFVNLLMTPDPHRPSCVIIIGEALGNLAGTNWKYFASYLGALGAFFAGSNTVSNLTFGGIQMAIAERMGLNASSILSLQSVGGAMGNMICIHNIVAVCSVLGLTKEGGYILKRTLIPMVIYGLVAAAVAYFL